MYHVLSRLACGPGLHLWLQSERGNCTSTVLLLARHESSSFLGSYHMRDSVFQRSIGPFLSERQKLYIKIDSHFPGVQIVYKDLVYFSLNIYEWHMLIILELCELGLRFMVPCSFVVHRSSFQRLHI